MKKIRLLMYAVLSLFSWSAYAYTSIAIIDGHTSQSWAKASNYESQKDADNDALEGCRVEARKNGIGALAKQCKIATRASVPGYGALVCSAEGCVWVTGHEFAQAAVDSAYQTCSKNYKNCREKDIDYWEDFAGFPKKTALAKPPAVKDCRPKTNYLQCKSSCTNGSCVVTYENGCQVSVQVPAKFNPLNNLWEYPAPSC